MKKLELAIKRTGVQLTSEKLEKLRKFGDLIEKNNSSKNNQYYSKPNFLLVWY